MIGEFVTASLVYAISVNLFAFFFFFGSRLDDMFQAFPFALFDPSSLMGQIVFLEFIHHIHFFLIGFGLIVTRLVLGYAYPALQCFKSMEKNRVEIQELRFWCQYWIIVAILTILEKVGDVLVSWIPIYGEMKLALFIFLWYPKTKGSGFVYESMLRPYVRKHEIDIERSLLEFRKRAWNLAIYFWDNCTELGSTKILQFFQSTNITPPIEVVMYDQRSVAAPPPTPPGKLSRLFKRNSPDKRTIHPF